MLFSAAHAMWWPVAGNYHQQQRSAFTYLCISFRLLQLVDIRL